MKIQVHKKFLLKIPNYLKACSASFLQAQSISFLIPTLNTFQDVKDQQLQWLTDLILMELNGEHSLVSTFNWAFRE